MKGTKEGTGEPCEFLSAASAGREIFEKVVCSVGKIDHVHFLQLKVDQTDQMKQMKRSQLKATLTREFLFFVN